MVKSDSKFQLTDESIVIESHNSFPDIKMSLRMYFPTGSINIFCSLIKNHLHDMKLNFKNIWLYITDELYTSDFLVCSFLQILFYIFNSKTYILYEEVIFSPYFYKKLKHRKLEQSWFDCLKLVNGQYITPQ